MTRRLCLIFFIGACVEDRAMPPAADTQSPAVVDAAVARDRELADTSWDLHMPDRRGEDAGVDAMAHDLAPAAACPPMALVCDDFEGQTVGVAPAGKWRQAQGASRIDGRRAHSGSKALLFSGERGIYARVEPVGWTAVRGDELHGRMMLYFEALPAGRPPAHFALVRGEGDGRWLRFGGANGSGTWDATYYYSGCDAVVPTAVPIPKGKWVCYEWSWNRATHAWSVWMDGVAARPLTFIKGSNAGCWSVPPITRISFGYMQDHPTSTPLALWVDDVAFGERRLGCPTR